MAANFPQTGLRYVSKNSKYLDPMHKELAKRAFNQESQIQQYDTFQSKIYDTTRRSFLFGRKEIVANFPFQQNEHFSILEVGSRTGYNLKNIADKFPNAHLAGTDMSSKMIAISKRKLAQENSRLTLINESYDEAANTLLTKRPNIILFSYAFTKRNLQWKELILQAKEDLTSIGYIAVVDFHDSRFNGFKNQMTRRQVQMDGQLLPFLQANFEPIHLSVNNAYGGLWQYFSFVGKLID